LDCQEIKGTIVSCPWHGRKFSPLASIALDKAPQAFEGPLHRCMYDGQKIVICARTDQTVTEDLDWMAEWVTVNTL
jgi:hypothetical protein